MEDKKKKSAIQVEIIPERGMTDAEVETVASLLVRWWVRECENKDRCDAAKNGHNKK
jgi:hypothetical protein